jgi:hypothetical protein
LLLFWLTTEAVRWPFTIVVSLSSSVYDRSP